VARLRVQSRRTVHVRSDTKRDATPRTNRSTDGEGTGWTNLVDRPGRALVSAFSVSPATSNSATAIHGAIAISAQRSQLPATHQKNAGLQTSPAGIEARSQVRSR